MADNVAITAGSGVIVAADEVVDGVLGSCKVQYVKIMDGTLDGTSKAAVGANGLSVNVAAGTLQTIANVVHVDDNDSTLSIDDGASSITVDNGGTFAVQNTDSLISETFVTKTIDFSASQTAQTIWDPTGGTKFVITDIIISASAAGTITLFDETDNTTLRVCKLNLAANGGTVINYRKPRISATADNVLKYTTGTVIEGSLTVSGYEV